MVSMKRMRQSAEYKIRDAFGRLPEFSDLRSTASSWWNTPADWKVSTRMKLTFLRASGSTFEKEELETGLFYGGVGWGELVENLASIELVVIG